MYIDCMFVYIFYFLLFLFEIFEILHTSLGFF
jgi:hypothetical protein